jgi:ketosteroid isomerase-like protein
MSEELPQALREFYDAWDEEGPGAIPRRFAPDAVWHDDPSGPDPDDHRGHDAIVGHLRDYIDVIGAFTVALEEVVPLADGRWFCEFRLGIRGEGSGIAWETPHAHVVRLDGGMIVEVWQVIDPSARRAELGLPPAGAG